MILFIGHEASRTGAPRSLLNIIKYVQTQTDLPIEILLRRGGDLLSEYKAIAPTTIWQIPDFANQSMARRIQNKLFKTFQKEKKAYIEQYKNKNVKLIFSNTCTNWGILEELSYLNVPIITRIPEMESVIRMFNENGEVTKNINVSKQIITPSEATKNNLIKNHGVQTEKISVCYGAVDKDFGKNIVFENIREKFNFPKDAFVVGNFGTVEPRKSPEAFILLAYLCRNIPNIYFLWVGKWISESEQYRLSYQIEQMGLKNRVFFVGQSSQVKSYYQAIDAVVMLSQEDPFPLVNLEAGFFEKPIICFKGSGGSEELIDENCGFVLPFLDLEAVLEKIVFLKENPTIRHQMGKNLAHKIKTQFTTEQTMPKIWEVIEKYL